MSQKEDFQKEDVHTLLVSCKKKQNKAMKLVTGAV
jgi:hypothetical protein